MDKVYVKAQWIRSLALKGYLLQPASYYEIELIPDQSEWKYISDDEVVLLIPELEKDGFIIPRLDERLRAEDLKITHRLLDLLNKGLD